MKVCKFGGSSLADAGQLTKVIDIVLSDPQRRIVVVSAPGKRDKDDTKVTDLLIALAKCALDGKNTASALDAVVARYAEIAKSLDLGDEIVQSIRDDLQARLAQVRTVKAGSTIGYGRTWAAPRDLPVGTVAAGYADGLPLALSNRGAVLVRGVPCPVVGRICMDFATVALDQAPDARAGDECVLLGRQGGRGISVFDWASLKATHPHDILCAIGPRVRRVYAG